MPKCNHYLWYFHKYEWIEEVYYDSDLPYNTWIWLLDQRRNWWHFFKYCPECWKELDRKSFIKYIKLNKQ